MLKVTNLVKRYPAFLLDNVSFEVPSGYITGFIGANGAGKSTTLKSVMNIVFPDSGEVEIFGKNMKTHETEIKQKIGFLMGAVNSYQLVKVEKYVDVTSSFYKEWRQDVCDGYLKKFGIDKNKKIKELSQGMKVKLGLAIALSHEADLFILDEPTSGLDPVARDEILEILSDIVSSGDKSVLFSTHITSDLEKCADYILFIKDGKIVENDTKDGLLDSYAIIRGGVDELTEDIIKKSVGVKKNKYNFSALISKEKLAGVEGFSVDRPTLEDISVYYGRGNGNV
ncbi:MAG: ABC transporter ATP-binding protein [Christensenellales bacterium]